ncbi:hypothetical protein [Nocardia yunnanensis]|uniref:hypothetical protein n=1 Tax=Nocardia yunnanensis TaxID=2382165 RepID=UPI0013C426DD|nr:hypothetical protein [Nocardia yunnanensis]
MADNAPIGLGSGNDAAWVTVHGSGDGATAVWAGYGEHSAGDVAVDTAVRSDSGAYDPRKDVDDILTDAAGGLDWFELVRARYLLAGGSAVMPALEPGGLRKLYYQQRGMRMNNLFGAGQRIQEVLPRIDRARGDHQQATGQLGEHWQGPTGETARAKLTGLSGWSDDTYDTVQVVPGVLSSVVDEIKSCVQRKADAFAKLDKVRRINGVDMGGGGDINSSNKDDAAAANDDVTLIIQYAKRAGIGDDARARIQVLAESGVFGRARLPHYIPAADVNSGGPGSAEAGKTKFDDAAQALCKVWTGHFKESAEGYFRAYSTLCEDTHAAVKGYLGVATEALTKVGQIDAPPMPKDGGAQGGWVPSGGVGSGGGGSGGAVSMPVSTSPAGVVPEATVPASTVPVTPAVPVPSSGSDALSTLNSVASGAGQFLQQGFSQIASTLEGLTKTAPAGTTPGTAAETPSAPGASGPASRASRQLFSVDLPGGRLVLTRSGDEALTASLTTPDGKTQRYTLTVKDGKPVLTAESDPATTAASTKSGDDTDPQSAVSHSVSADTHHAGTPDNAVYQQPSSGLPMGMGAAGTAARAAENEPPRGSIAPPRPLWTDDPGASAKAVPDRAVPEADNSGPATRGESPAAVATPPVTAVRADGVKIEIEMGGEQRGAVGTR